MTDVGRLAFIAVLGATAMLGSCARSTPSSTPEGISDQNVVGSGTTETSSSSSSSPPPPPPTANVGSTTIEPPTATSTTTTRLRLVGKVVVLDPGHNGGNGRHATEISRKVDIGNGTKECDTAGTQTDGGYPEHAFTWDVVSRLRTQLEADGITVVLTRAGDDGWGPCIDERGAIGNTAAADAAVSVHADGGPTSGRGFHVIMPGDVPGLTDTIVEPSARLGAAIHAAYGATGIPPATYIGRHDGFDTRTDLGGLNTSKVPKVFIECANMRNAVDAPLLTSEAGRAMIATALSAGIEAYLSAP